MKRLPQRLLAIELRTEIDRALLGDARATRRALDLARDPGARSSHVRHNLRAWRVAWLEGARLRALSQVDPKPLVGDMEDKMVRKNEELLPKDIDERIPPGEYLPDWDSDGKLIGVVHVPADSVATSDDFYPIRGDAEPEVKK